MLFATEFAVRGTWRRNPLEVPYSTGLIHAAFFCELKQHRVNMRAFTFACQITDLIAERWTDAAKYCATERNFNDLLARLARGCTG